MIACQNCGANVKFDIASQKMRCEYCDSYFDPYSFDKKESDGIELKDFDATVFICPQCGGEILSTDDTAAGFCSFCGASTILHSRIQKENRPNYIIPFRKTKDDCKQAYSDLMKKAIFAPKELKDPKYIDGFRGIYMPYWTYYITQKGPFIMNGKKQHRSGDYIVSDHYELIGNLDAYYKGISFDASSSFADNISEALAPYDVKGMKAFTPAYLSGFYADTADVSADTYKPQAVEIAETATQNQITGTSQFSAFTLETDVLAATADALDKTLNTSNVPKRHSGAHGYTTKFESIDYSMFPVWFMSYRNGDRVAYATVNGQTGKVVADLPVDEKKFVGGSFILALPIFLLLCLLFTPTPMTSLVVTGIISVITGIIYFLQLRKIEDKKKKYTGPVFLIISLVLFVGIALFKPVRDMWYYLACILLTVSDFVTLTEIIAAYNVLSTRELPQFNHKGGDDRA